MNTFLQVGITTFLRFLGQFLFLKSIAHLGEKVIFDVLNLQSLAVLIAGFSSGGVQTYLSKHLSTSQMKLVWKVSSQVSTKNFFYSILIIVPLYCLINDLTVTAIPLIIIGCLSLLLSFSNNWQGLLTGKKSYPTLLTLFLTQALTFLGIFVFKKELPDTFFLYAYPATVVFSYLLTYVVSQKKILSNTGEISQTDILSEIKKYRALGIVLMTAGVAYPFLVRNILTDAFSFDLVIDWDYMMRISTAYTSVSSFFVFTLFASDLSRDDSKKNQFIACSVALVIPYLLIFYFFNQQIFSILLSREIHLTTNDLMSFVGYELIRAFFTANCLYMIIKTYNSRYIATEVANIVIASAVLYVLRPATLSGSFMYLALAIAVSFIFSTLLKLKKNSQL